MLNEIAQGIDVGLIGRRTSRHWSADCPISRVISTTYRFGTVPTPIEIGRARNARQHIGGSLRTNVGPTGDDSYMTTGIGIALVVVLLGIAAFVVLGMGGKSKTLKTKEEPAKAASPVAESTVAESTPEPEPSPNPFVEPSPEVPAEDLTHDDEEDEEMVTIQASPEELAQMMAEIKGRNTDAG